MTLDLASAATLRSLMAQHGFRIDRRLGQNFLVDRRVLQRVVDACSLAPEDVVLEIGPGFGALTQALAARAGRVVAVEVDRRLVALLQQVLAGEKGVEIVHADALKADLAGLLAARLAPGQRAKAAGNLPYYITTPVIMRLLEEDLPLERIVAMVQREVAERLVAPPGSRVRGAISAAIEYYTEAAIVARVPPGAFLPQPEVESAVVQLKVRPAPPVEAPRATFFALVRAAFSQRRKTLHNALSGGLRRSKEEVHALLQQAGIDPMRRGETISIEEFAALARLFGEI